MIKQLPKDWKWKKLDEISNKISLNKIKIKQKDYLSRGTFPVVDQGQDLIGGYYNDETLLIPNNPPYIVFGDHTKIKKYINFNFIAGADGVKVLKAKDNIDSKFLFYSLFTIKVENKGYARHFQLLEKELFPLPTKLIQEAIVAKIEELFSELDKGIEQLKTAQQQLKIYRQSVLKWAFEGKLTEEWRLNYDSCDLVDKQDLPLAAEPASKYKTKNNQSNQTNPINQSSDNAELPEGWKWVKLKNISESIQYGYTESSSKDVIGPKFLRITDIQDNNVNWDEVPYCKIDETVKGKYLLKDGDLVFARTGATVGKSFLIKGEIPEAVFASYLIRVRVNEEMNEKYLSYFFHSNYYWSQITEGQVGIGQPNVNGTKLGQLILPIAILQEQNQIVQEIESRLSVADKMEESISQSLQQAEALRQSILKKAFEGRLV